MTECFSCHTKSNYFSGVHERSTQWMSEPKIPLSFRLVLWMLLELFYLFVVSCMIRQSALEFSYNNYKSGVASWAVFPNNGVFRFVAGCTFLG